jgi:predicted Zn-dependent peptidase
LEGYLYKKAVLANGLRVLTVTMPHTRSVTIAIYLGVGSRFEPQELGGVSHFVEHMLFKGTTNRPTAAEISEAIEGVGGILNAGTSREYTVYWAKVPAPYFSRSLDVLIDMLLNSKFELSEVDRERQVIVEELHMNLDSPSDLVGDLIDEVVWPDQPLGRNVLGTEETLASTGRDELVGYVAEHYVANNILISVAGQVEHEDVVSQVEAALGKLEPRSLLLAEPAANQQLVPRLKVHTKDTEQGNLIIAVPALSYREPDRYSQGIMDTILGHGMSSRLFVEIRERQGLAYSVSSYVSQYADAGALMVYAGVQPDQAERAILGILLEMRKLAETAVPASELTKAKEYNKGRLLLSLEDTRGVATWIGGQELLMGEVLSVDEIMARIDSVTAQDVQRMARQLFDGEKLNLAIVGPFSDETRFASLLKTRASEVGLNPSPQEQ